MKLIIPSLLLFFLIACDVTTSEHNTETEANEAIAEKEEDVKDITLVVLGNVQDAGSPQIGCTKDCCKDLFDNPDHTRRVVSLGLVDPKSRKKYMFEASPDFVAQAKHLSEFGFDNGSQVPDGIFLSHAHIGHYAGLMYLGKEAMNADRTRVYAMPKMRSFLRRNGPWSQLVSNNNIELRNLSHKTFVQLSNNISVYPIRVPHRDEYSETAGFKIEIDDKKVLFIPDIDKWDKWNEDIIELIKECDYAFIDATFYDGKEINNRDISEIPHPFIVESMEKFKGLSKSDKEKVHFIHFNHTNPVLDGNSPETKEVLKNGFKIARFGDTFTL